jgi:surfactin synthase thioesterase subunit
VYEGLDVGHLFVAASPSDGFPARGKGMHLLPREALVRELATLGTSAIVLQNERLLDLFLPSIRADLELATEYRVLPGPTLTCPITVFAGTRDPEISVCDMEGWARHTTGPFLLKHIPAAHDVIKERPAAIVDEILRALEGAPDVHTEER